MKTIEMKSNTDYYPMEATVFQPTHSLRKTSSKAWAILACAGLFYLYEYILRVSPSVMTEGLMLDFGVTSTALGVLVSFYYFSYVILQIPCGVIVDRIGPRLVITFSAILCVIGSIIFAESTSLFTAQIGRFIIGAGSACAYISYTKIGAEWFHPTKFAMIAGIGQMMGTLGGVFGALPFAILSNFMGWRSAMFTAAMVGIAVALVTWLVISDRPGENDKPNQYRIDRTDHTGSLLDNLKIVASNPQNWLIGLYGCMMYLPLSAFAELWAVPYLMKLYSINNELASTASIMVFLGVAVGCPLAAWLSNALKSRLKVMSWAALGTLIIYLIVLYIPNIPIMVMFPLLFLSGVVNAGQILYFAAAKEITPPQASGTTIGFTNCLVMVSGFVFQPLLGRLIDFVWDGQLKPDGTPLYSIDAYQISLSVIPISLLIGWFILKFVKETYPTELKKI